MYKMVKLTLKTLHVFGHFVDPRHFRIRSSHPEVFCEKALQGCNIIKNETPPQVSSSEYCEVFKNTYFKEHLRTVAAFVCLRVIVWLLFSKIDLYIWRKPNGLWNIPDGCPENCLAKTLHRDIIQNNFERIFANFLLLYPLKT